MTIATIGKQIVYRRICVLLDRLACWSSRSSNTLQTNGLFFVPNIFPQHEVHIPEHVFCSLIKSRTKSICWPLGAGRYCRHDLCAYENCHHNVTTATTALHIAQHVLFFTLSFHERLDAPAKPVRLCACACTIIYAAHRNVRQLNATAWMSSLWWSSSSLLKWSGSSVEPERGSWT